MKKRVSRKIACAVCGTLVWSSSHKKPYVCAPCKRKMGMTTAGRKGSGYTALTVAPRQDQTVGDCTCGCGRKNIPLVNGKCDDWHWYFGMADVDEELSANARKGRGGTNDWVKRAR